MRQPGIEVSDKTEKLPLPDSAVRILRRTPLAPLRKGSCRRSRLRGRFFQRRIENVLMRLLRQPGIEVSIKTGKLPRTPLAPLRKGSCQRKLTEGSFFRRRIQAVPIRLLRCPERSLTAKPAQRATDGRPYELKSVPTKTVAIRTREIVLY